MAIETGDCPSDDCPSYHALSVIAEAKAAGIIPAPSEAASKSYSVLLLYPEYANDSGTETYYAFVEAPDPIDAVAVPSDRPSRPRSTDDLSDRASPRSL